MIADTPADRADPMLDTDARVPEWTDLPDPAEDDTFRSYWSRQGVDHGVIDRMFDGLAARTAECAHVRMSHYLQSVMPQAWGRHLESWLREHNIRPTGTVQLSG